MIDTQNCRYGRMMYLLNDKYIGKSLNYYRESHCHEIELLKQTFNKGSFIDVGANFGVFTIPLSKQANYVYAFEPQKFIYHILCGNMALNKIHNVTCYNLAVTNNNEDILFVQQTDYEGENNFGGIKADYHWEENSCLIDSISIDDVVTYDVTLIKIDVEGMEFKVLEGAVETICEFKPVLYIEFLENREKIVEFLNHNEYNYKLHEAPLFNRNNFANRPENILLNENGCNLVSCDLLAWHKDKKLEATSPYFVDLDKSKQEKHAEMRKFWK